MEGKSTETRDTRAEQRSHSDMDDVGEMKDGITAKISSKVAVKRY
jgi:hypothetical protein